MDLCFKFNHSFICKRRRRGGGERVPPCAHTGEYMTHKNLQRYLDRDLCNVKPIKQSKQEKQGVSKQCISLSYWLYRAPWRCILDFGFVRGVSVTGWGSPHIADFNQHLCGGVLGLADNRAWKLDFFPLLIAIGRTVKADSSLLTKA